MRLTPPDRFLRRARATSKGGVEVAARSIYIFPTSQGFLFGVLIVLMLLGSINYSNNLGFLLTFLLAGLGVVAILHTWRNLVGLRLEAGRSEPVFAGQPARFELHLVNRRSSTRPGVWLQPKEGEAVAADLKPEQSEALSIGQPTWRRGYQTLDRFTISTRYPLGLLKAWVYVDLDTQCLVYPQPGPKMPPSEAPDFSSSAQGDKGIGVDDFVGLRQYRPSDSPKHINWKALAREQGLQTKQFGGDRSDRRWLDWESLKGMDDESRLSHLCRGVLDACDLNQEFGLRLPGQTIEPARGQTQRHRCLTALALYGERP
jgi:uncharacterized protein (DUF58 family)